MREDSALRSSLAVLFCLFVATTQILLVVQASVAGPPGEPDALAASPDQGELVELLREIRDAMQSGPPTSATPGVDQTAVPTGTERMDASRVTLDAGLMKRLEDALGGLSAQVDRMSDFRGPAVGLREEADAWPERPVTSLLTRFASGSEANKELQFMSYREVLKTLGPPSGINKQQGGEIAWTYSKGVLIFIDGFVARVYRPD